MANSVVESWKFTLAQLHQTLNALKKAEPTPENLALVHRIEKQAKEITVAIRHYKAAHGMAA